MFRNLDTDQSGELSAGEWRAKTTRMADLSDWAGRGFDRIDTDGSGTLDREEFVQAIEAQYRDVAPDEQDREPGIDALFFSFGGAPVR